MLSLSLWVLCLQAEPAKWRAYSGAPAGIRTPDTLLKRQVLCLLSYWGIWELLPEAGHPLERGPEEGYQCGWDGGTRTHYIGVKVRCVTITLHPNIAVAR